VTVQLQSPLASAFTAPKVFGLNDQTQTLLGELLTQWTQKFPRNVERMIYLDAKNRLKDLRIAIPPEVVNDLEVVVGWPEKAVYGLSNRIVWEGVTSASGSEDPLELRSLLRANRFAIELQQAIPSSLAHSVAFGTTTPGDVNDGQPPVMMMFHSAVWATGLWDKARRCLRGGLLINETDSLGQPTKLTLMTPAETLVCVKGPKMWYLDDRFPHRLRRVPMEHLPFRPTLDRPFGRSRIDRVVMSLTDRAVRASARLELHSELFSALKLILLGVEDEAFVDPSGRKIPLWDWYMGRFNTLSKDEDGDTPTLEKITAESPEPHIAVRRQLASEFSGHTGIPLASLGIATDNPASAQAMDKTSEDVIIDAMNQRPVYNAALDRMFENAVMIRDGLSEPPAEAADLANRWRNPGMPSVVSQSDAMVKQISAIPRLAETEVALEELGYSDEQILRIQSDFRRLDGAGTLGQMLDRAGTAPSGDPSTAPVADAADLKARFDALGVAVRSGVDPDDAAKRLGLGGILFTGAVPVSLRQPEDEATRLEDK
jgi:hypothetical protein